MKICCYFASFPPRIDRQMANRWSFTLSSRAQNKFRWQVMLYPTLKATYFMEGKSIFISKYWSHILNNFHPFMEFELLIFYQTIFFFSFFFSRNNIPLCLSNQGWFIDCPNNNTLNKWTSDGKTLYIAVMRFLEMNNYECQYVCVAVT